MLAPCALTGPWPATTMVDVFGVATSAAADIGTAGLSSANDVPPFVERYRCSPAGVDQTPRSQSAIKPVVLQAARIAGPAESLQGGVHVCHDPLTRRAPPTTSRSTSTSQPADPWITSCTCGTGPAPTGM